MTAGQRLIEQGRQQGIEQGRQQGIEQGRQQGIEQGRQQGIEQLLLRQLRQCFGGAVNAVVEQRIATASVEEIETWSVRVLSAATRSDCSRTESIFAMSPADARVRLAALLDASK